MSSLSRYGGVFDALSKARAPLGISPMRSAERKWTLLPAWALGLTPPKAPPARLRTTPLRDRVLPLPEWWPVDLPVLVWIDGPERAGLYVQHEALYVCGLVMSRHVPTLLCALGGIVREGGSLDRFRQLEELAGREAAVAAANSAIEIERSLYR